MTSANTRLQYEILGERSNDWFSKESLDLENIFK